MRTSTAHALPILAPSASFRPSTPPTPSLPPIGHHRPPPHSEEEEPEPEHPPSSGILWGCALRVRGSDARERMYEHDPSPHLNPTLLKSSAAAVHARARREEDEQPRHQHTDVGKPVEGMRTIPARPREHPLVPPSHPSNRARAQDVDEWPPR